MLNFSLLAILVIMNLCLGSSKRPSIIGIKNCSREYWIIFVTFIVLCIIYAKVAVRIAQNEYILKARHDRINLCESDIPMGGHMQHTVLGLGFVGGFVAGALGLGGGAIFNPALLTLGLPPKVCSSTGLYLVTFSKIASCLVYFLNDELDLGYGLWIGILSTIGTILSLFATRWYMRVSGRQSFIVWVLVFMFIVSVFAIPIFGGQSLLQLHRQGKDIFAF